MKCSVESVLHVWTRDSVCHCCLVMDLIMDTSVRSSKRQLKYSVELSFHA
jgi:hypothetical protein